MELEAEWPAAEKIVPREEKKRTDRTVLKGMEKRYRLQAEFSCELMIGT